MYQTLDFSLLRDRGTHSFQFPHPRLDINHFDPSDLRSRSVAKRQGCYSEEDPSIKARNFPICWLLSGLIWIDNEVQTPIKNF